MISSRPCWQPESVQYALPIDAGAMRAELFRVVHVPSLITRHRFKGFGSAEGQGEQVTEQEVLSDLLRGDAAMRVAAISGEVGTGKSHVVRWLFIELSRFQQSAPEYSHLHVVYVPKTRTTLRGVVERVLQGQEGERFEEVRARLQRAQDTFNQDTAPDRLVDGLANAMSDLKGLEETQKDVYRKLLVHQLPTLLQDPIFRQRLVAGDGVIRRTIDRTLERRGASETPPRFDNLVFAPDLLDVSEMSTDARKLFAKLAGGDNRLREPALALMNEQLDRAVGALFDVRRGEVGDLLLDVREELAKDGRELVLLIEDFALLQGVERELLEAVIAPIEEVGGRRLCPVRAAFAVTTGHFEDMNTVLSRLDADGGHRYSLDAKFAGEAEVHATSDTVQTLVGSYLNAARLGQEQIETWAKAHPDATGSPSNACDECTLQPDCHRSFGTSPLGHGLYPFNAAALERLVMAHGVQAFEPRELLKHVRETIRDEYPAMSAGLFPSEEWARRHNPALTPTSNDVLNGLRAAHPDERAAQQAEYLLMFWGGHPDTVVNLDPDIHEAFGVVEIDDAPLLKPGAATPRRTVPDTPKPRPARPKADEPPQSPLQREIDALAAWRQAVTSSTTRESELEPRLARELRQAVAKHSLERARVDLDFLSYDKKIESDLADGVYISGAAGGNPRTEERILLRLGPDDEELFIALRRHKARETLADDDIIALNVGIGQRVPTVLKWLTATIADGSKLCASAQLLYLGSLLASREADGATGADAIATEGLFETHVEAVGPGAPPKLAEFHAQACGREREEARELVERACAVRQGPVRGGPAGVDAAAVLAFIDELQTNDIVPSSSSARTGPAAALTRSAAIVDAALEGVDTMLAATQQSLEQIGDAAASEIGEAFRAAVDALTNANVPVGDATELRGLAQEFATVDLRRFRQRTDEALSDRPKSWRLAAAARVPWSDRARIDRFFAVAAQALARAEQALQSDAGDGGDPIGQRTVARETGESLALTLGDLETALAGEGPVAS